MSKLLDWMLNFVAFVENKRPKTREEKQDARDFFDNLRMFFGLAMFIGVMLLVTTETGRGIIAGFLPNMTASHQ